MTNQDRNEKQSGSKKTNERPPKDNRPKGVILTENFSKDSDKEKK